MKMKYMPKPSYPEVDIIGKTVTSETGTIDRRPIGRKLITAEPGFGEDDKVVLDGDGVTIQSVKKVDELEILVMLVDGQKSAASFKFFEVYTAANKENPEVVDLFTIDADKVERARKCAERMCAANPGCDGQYKFVNKATGERVFLRTIDRELTPNGKRVMD